jgi:hypothetical protein
MQKSMPTQKIVQNMQVETVKEIDCSAETNKVIELEVK